MGKEDPRRSGGGCTRGWNRAERSASAPPFTPPAAPVRQGHPWPRGGAGGRCPFKAAKRRAHSSGFPRPPRHRSGKRMASSALPRHCRRRGGRLKQKDRNRRRGWGGRRGRGRGDVSGDDLAGARPRHRPPSPRRPSGYFEALPALGAVTSWGVRLGCAARGAARRGGLRATSARRRGCGAGGCPSGGSCCGGGGFALPGQGCAHGPDGGLGLGWAGGQR